MRPTTSIATMIQRLDGMLGTNDLSDWEAGFVESVVEKTGGGRNTTGLTSAQVDKITSLFDKHFAG